MRDILRFLNKILHAIVFIALEVLSLVLIFSNNKYQNLVIAETMTEITGDFNNTFSGIENYFNLKKVNEQLLAENNKLRQMNENSFIKYDSKKFIVNDTTYVQNYEYIQANVISNSVNKQNNYIWLNKGRNCGIEPDMAVISPTGVVGIVKAVSEHFSTVMSLLHKDINISSKISSKNHIGPLQWNGDAYDKMLLKDISSNSNVEIGDTVVTSGHSPKFPAGIMIGIVESVDKDESGVFLNIVVKLSTNMSILQDVNIVVNLFNEEQQKLLKMQEGDE
ncbi:cell shape-determining protein MreC [Bacteroidia bacterium]|nr:cell shape-determining protein MreC [Bacteroidia bacterium]